MGTTFNGTEQKIISVVAMLAAPVSRTAIVKAAGIADGSNVTKALARLTADRLIASTRSGRSSRYGPIPSVEEEAVPDAPADMSPVESIAEDLMSGKNGQVIAAIHRVTELSVEDRAAVRALIIARMLEGEARTTLIAEAGLVPTGDECRAAIAEGAAKRRRASGARGPKERPLLNTTERYIVNTLAFHGAPMTRKEVDQACKLRGGSIAGHAVKKAYAALVERDMIARAGDSDAERFQITDEGREKYVATLGGTPVELLLVPQWIPPAKR
jgi:hypothetical protein